MVGNERDRDDAPDVPPGVPSEVPPESKPHRWEAPTSPAGQPVCDLCGFPMRESHCKLICDQCGYIRDCSDP